LDHIEDSNYESDFSWFPEIEDEIIKVGLFNNEYYGWNKQLEYKMEDGCMLVPNDNVLSRSWQL